MKSYPLPRLLLAGLLTLCLSGLVSNLRAANEGGSPIVVPNDPNSPIIGGSGFSPASYQNVPFSGNIYDVVLLNSPSVTVIAKAGHITRVAFIDPTNNICFLEFSGAGNATVAIPNPLIAPPVHYNQPGLSYAKGYATVALTGHTLGTFFSVYSLGTDASRVNPSLIINPGGITGIAQIQKVVLTGPSIGGMFLSNVQFTGLFGQTGITAPILTTAGFFYINNISAMSAAVPTLQFGNSPSLSIIVSGGNMLQNNGLYIQCSGVKSVVFGPGTTSTGVFLPKQFNLGRYFQNGQDVTAKIVAN